MSVNKWLHILSEFYDYSWSYWLSIDEIKTEISGYISELWLTELWNYYHSFWKDAYTGVVCLAESHVSIHTWPETQYLTLDIYVCNYLKDNSNKAVKLFQFLKELYSPKEYNVQYIER